MKFSIRLDKVKKAKPVEMDDGMDIFRYPTGPAIHTFVNNVYCLGSTCPQWSCCVNTCPNAFQFKEVSGTVKAARKESMGATLGCGEEADYRLHLAVGQCPQNCLYFVSKDQQAYLEHIQNQMEWEDNSVQMEIDTLVSISEFENGRWQG